MKKHRGVSQIVAALMLIIITIAAMVLYIINFTMYFERGKGILVNIFSQRKEMLLERLSFIYFFSNDTHINIIVYNYGDVNISIADIVIDSTLLDKSEYKVMTIEGKDLGYVVPINDRLVIISISKKVSPGLHSITIFTSLGNSFTYEFSI